MTHDQMPNANNQAQTINPSTPRLVPQFKPGSEDESFLYLDPKVKGGEAK